MDVAAFLHEWGPIIGGIVVGLPPWIKVLADKRKTAASEAEATGKLRNDLVHIAQEAAGAVIEDLRIENARVRDQLARIEREFGEFRRVHDSMIADKDAELAMLRGENRQLKALAEAYERLLEANHIPHEKPAQPFWRVPQGSLPPGVIEPL